MTDPISVIDLTGSWRFGTDADDMGLDRGWFAPDHRLPGEITVPAAWNTLGIEFDRPEQLAAWLRQAACREEPLRQRGLLGAQTEADRMRHVFPGPAWYQTTVEVPPDWSAERTVLVLEGVQRSARVWVDGREVGEVVGAIVPTRIDVSTAIRAGRPLVITVRVDARRDPERDPWWGCRDTLDFLFLSWGGIWAPVRLVGEPAVRVTSVGLRTDLVAGTVAVEVLTSGRDDDLQAEVRLDAPDGAPLGQDAIDVVDGLARVTLTVDRVRPWSPEDPARHRLQIRLADAAGPVATWTGLVGLRELRAVGTELVLNGRPFFARGYGDDCIFPDTIAPPCDVAAWRDRLRLAKAHGFNWVRLHSWVPPEALLMAADEVGMFVQPELPTGLTWEPPASSTHDLVRQRWAELILAWRHHPSIAVWCMGNELYDGHSLGVELYATARRLDPDRLVIESDGTRPGDVGRDTLDLAVVQFAEGGSPPIGAEAGTKYMVDPGWTKPVIAHEVGYFATLPDPDSSKQFGSGIQPYWLTDTAAAAAHVPAATYARWREVSVALQQTCLKINTEAIRASGLAGWSHWLLHDYPACAEGIVDVDGGSKGTDPAWVRRVNQAVVVLAPGLEPNHRSGSTLRLTPMLSVFEHELPAAVDLTLAVTTAAGAEIVVERREVMVTMPRQRLPELTVELPPVDVVTPLTVTLTVTGGLVTDNEWSAWVWPDRHPTGSSDVLVASSWSDEVSERLAAGGRVLLTDPTGCLPVSRGSFRPAAWDGAGHHGMIMDPDHPAVVGLRTDGWADLRTYRLIEGALIMDLEPGSADAVIIRAIDRPDRLADRCVLAEFRVGPGRLLVSGLNLTGARDAGDPVADVVLDGLIRYTEGESFVPTVELPRNGSAE